MLDIRDSESFVMQTPHRLVFLTIALCLAGVADGTGVETDNFADAMILGSGSVSWTGTNVGATVESGESQAPFGRRTGTLWFEWQATTSGWWEATATVTGHGIIGIGTGNTVGSYQEQAFALGGRLVFEAAAGQNYRIAVGGDSGAEGEMGLQILPCMEPALRVVGARLSNDATTLDVSAMHPQVELDLDVVSSGKFAAGTVRLWRADGGLAWSRRFKSRDRESGNSTAGVYCIPFEISSQLPAGDYFLEYSLRDADERSVTAGLGRRNWVAPQPGILTQIEIVNSGMVDVTAPGLTESNVPEPVDLAYGSGQAVFLLGASDGGSGVLGGIIVLTPLNGGESLEFDFDDQAQVSGSPSDGRYLVSCEMAVSSGMTYASKIVIYDLVGNSVVSAGADVVCVDSRDGFPEWTIAKGLTGAESLPQRDDDGDGISNLLEYAFGMEPDCPDAAQSHSPEAWPRYPIVRYESQPSVVVEYTRRVGATDLAYFPEGSVGLTFDVPVPQIQVLWSDGIFERVRCQAILPEGAQTYFARVRVEVLSRALP
jgi:hypothetical protein